jgi:hypothetical protein
MRRLLILAAAMAMMLGLVATPSMAQQPAQTDYDIRIVGNASLGGWYPWGTMVVVPVQVRCPEGEGVSMPFAGVGEFGVHFPSMTIPRGVTCTGDWVDSQVYGASRSRNAPPPWHHFEHGRTQVMAQIGGGGVSDRVLARTTKTVMVRVPPGEVPEDILAPVGEYENLQVTAVGVDEAYTGTATFSAEVGRPGREMQFLYDFMSTNHVYFVDGVQVDKAAFEAALSVGDRVDTDYQPAASSSTFRLTNR